ncbi:hypothetical protein DF145_34970 [Burkholderia stagnalis]|nr:hypothetical protein DF145_34970 [Burkholderia stagnalis]
MAATEVTGVTRWLQARQGNCQVSSRPLMVSEFIGRYEPIYVTNCAQMCNVARRAAGRVSNRENRHV